MKHLLVLALAATACGSPFTSVVGPEDGGSTESTVNTDSGKDVVTANDVQTHEDSDTHDVLGTGDVSDAGSLPDSVTPDETGSSPDAGPCLPPTSYQYKIFSGGSTFVGYPSPAECQCTTTYTCACLLAAPGICTATFGAPTGCTFGTVITIDCSP